MIKIKIGKKTYNVNIAYSDEEKEKGLQNIDTLPDNEGMLFVWDEPQEISMWMEDTNIPLDIIFIDDDLNVIKIYQGEPNSEELLTEQNVSYVLEVNVNSDIKIGDELEFSPDSKIKSDKMLVLDENGKPQMKLSGGERIFSRSNTKILIKFAKKADSTKKDSDYKALGKRIFKFLKVQDENEPEFVQSKN